MEDQHIEGIPNGNWTLKDSTWFEGDYYHSVDTNTKTVYGFYYDHEYPNPVVDAEWDWDSLEDAAKELIIEEFKENRYE